MSDLNVNFNELLQEMDIETIESRDSDFLADIVYEIVDNAMSIAEDEQESVRSSESIVHSVIADVLNVATGVTEHWSLSSISTSSSETSSESSYRVPSYLNVRSRQEIADEAEVEPEEQEHCCEQYEEIDIYAGVVVDQIIEKALEVASRHIPPPIEESSDYTEETSYSTDSTVVEWPTLETFTDQLGLKKIYEFMDTWDFEEDWLYCVDFLSQFSDDCSDYYIYEAQWSIPTEMYPVPQATARIYFTIECCRVKPPACPVNVTYVYEGTSFVHTLSSVFSEDRLFEIVDAKLKFFQRLTF